MSSPRISDGKLYLDGRFVTPTGAKTDPVLEKATGRELGRYVLGGRADADRAVASARAAQPGWAARLPDERATLLRRIADVLLSRRDEFVDVLIRETGGVRAKAETEVFAAVRKLHESSGLANRMAGELPPGFKPGKLVLSQRIPLGVVAAITPWNFPLLLAMRPLAPALALGNTVVLKPAELTPIAGGQLLMEVFDEAGTPPGVVNLVTGEGPDAGEPLAEHPDVAMIHFTGSVEIGRRMASIATRDFRRTSLELGGDNAFVVLDDADLDAAVACGAASFDFQGQTCITASRHIVQRGIAADYTAALAARARALRVGDPATGDVDLGPMISAAQLDRLHRQLVEPSVRMGAQVIEGARHDGLFYRPTVLTEVKPDMPVFTEEVFGPVAPITVVDTEEEALSLTNAFPALVNAVHTGDLVRGLAFAERVHCGIVHVNDVGGRPHDEGDLEAFTKHRWIGIQRTAL